MERLNQFNIKRQWNPKIQSYEEITTDPTQLSDKYLESVNRRLFNGTATDQDRLYANEVAARKELGKIKDPKPYTFTQETDKGVYTQVTVDIPEGFRKINKRSYNDMPIFTNGKLWISADKTGHKGGIWKVWDKEKLAGSSDPSKRLGTYDANLKRIAE